jgi:hypothetical protein
MIYIEDVAGDSLNKHTLVVTYSQGAKLLDFEVSPGETG